jgi:hypothetical protein
MGLALVLSSLGLVLSRKTIFAVFVLICAAMAVWYVYTAGAFVSAFILGLRNLWLHLQIAFFGTAAYQTAGPTPGRLALRYSQLVFFVVYTLLGLHLMSWIILRWRTGSSLRTEKALLAMIAFLTPIAFIISPGEGIPRLIVLSSTWIISLLLLTKPKRLAVAGLMVLFPLLLPIARFAGEGIWPYVGTTVLRGAQFFAATVDPPRPPQAIFAQHGVLSLIIHFNPDYFSVLAEEPISADRPNIFAFDVATLGAAHVPYFILNRQGHDQLLWGYGIDPFESWPQTERGRLTLQLYDSGGFQVYSNPEARSPGITPGGP